MYYIKPIPFGQETICGNKQDCVSSITQTKLHASENHYVKLYFSSVQILQVSHSLPTCLVCTHISLHTHLIPALQPRTCPASHSYFNLQKVQNKKFHKLVHSPFVKPLCFLQGRGVGGWKGLLGFPFS